MTVEKKTCYSCGKDKSPDKMRKGKNLCLSCNVLNSRRWRASKRDRAIREFNKVIGWTPTETAFKKGVKQ